MRLTESGAEYTRDFIHVLDVVEGIIWVAKALLELKPDVVGEAFNISSGQEYPVRHILETIIKGYKPGSEYIEVKEGVKYLEIVNQCANNEKMKQVLGWSPKISLMDGLRMLGNSDENSDAWTYTLSSELGEASASRIDLPKFYGEQKNVRST